MSFSNLGLTPILTAPLPAIGYTQPTPVQAAAIPIVLKGDDLVARAQTGTGKTAAFALPMIDRLLVRKPRAKGRRASGLVLVPTRELAVQVHRALVAFGRPVDLRVTVIVGGMPMFSQVKALREGADIIVATPGRLIDHLQRRTVDLSGIEILTLDEGDRMLDMGFLPPLRRILQAVPQTRQTLLFSATMSAAVIKLAAEFSREPQRIDVSNGEAVAPTICHRIHPVDLDSKRALLLHVLTQAPVGQALVFCKTKRGADRVGTHLQDAGIKAAVIHGNKTQGARTRSLTDFRTGRASVLVATDIAARGLDVARLPLVVNYDLPLVAEDYIHRVGRTGRAGLAGRAVSLVTNADRHLLRDIQKLLSTPLEHVVVNGFEARGGGATDDRRPSAPRPSRRPFNRQGTTRTRRESGSRTTFPAATSI
jgi:ATP-dependent RNA helicase RhlE